MALAGGNPAVAVVGQQFMASYPVDLTIVSKMTILGDKFGVTDSNGNIMFKVKSKSWSLRERHILLDAAGNPIVSLQEKIVSLHRRWKVYRGDSKDSKDLLFSVKQSSYQQSKVELDVFLASNTSEHNCDFNVKCSWSQRSCTIHAGNSSTVIAQFHNKLSVRKVVLGKGKFSVTIHPNVDHAFIVALVLILNEINEDIKATSYLNMVWKRFSLLSNLSPALKILGACLEKHHSKESIPLQFTEQAHAHFPRIIINPKPKTRNTLINFTPLSNS